MPRPKLVRPTKKVMLKLPIDLHAAVAAKLRDPVREVLYQTERGARYGRLSALVTELLDQWLREKKVDCIPGNNVDTIKGGDECPTQQQ